MKNCFNGSKKTEFSKKSTREGAFSLLRHSGEHIFDENAVAAGGVAHKDVGHRADELAVLNNGAAAHFCVNIGTTNEKNAVSLYTQKAVKNSTAFSL